MKCFFSIIYLSFSISVFSQNLDLKKLESIINEYERFKAFDKEKYPLGDLSEDRFKNEYNFFMQIRSRLSKISLKNLSENEKISYELLVFIIENQINNYNFNTRYNPILSDSGFHNSIIYIVRNLKNKKDAIRYLKLLKAIPLYVDQNIYLIQKGINEGISQPKIIFKGYESSYNKHITVDYNDNYYYTPFLNLPDNISSKIKDSLTKEAQKIINRSVIPSFKKIKSFFEKNYFPFTRNNISISSTPNGIEYYKNRIKFYTTLELTASEIHEIGLKEVKKIRQIIKWS